MDDLDTRLIQLLQVNARMPLVKLAKALGCARSTAQLRLTALEQSGVITGYTVTTNKPNAQALIRAMVLIAIDSKLEAEVVKNLSKRYEISKLYSVSGRYDLCAIMHTETTHELDSTIEKIRSLNGVSETFSTILLATKFDRPDF